MKISLDKVTDENGQLLTNLMLFLRYELMPYDCGNDLNQYATINGDESRTHDKAVQGLEGYWQNPESICSYIIRFEKEIASFASIVKSPHPEVDFRMAEFLIVSKYQRKGIGKEAAFLFFDKFTGKWVVGWVEGNESAAAFWRSVVSEYTNEQFENRSVAYGTDFFLPGVAFNTC